MIKIKCICVRTGKVAQQLRALGTLAEDPSLAPRGYIVEGGGLIIVCDSSSGEMTPSSGFHKHLHPCTYTQTHKHAHNLNFKIKKRRFHIRKERKDREGKIEVTRQRKTEKINKNCFTTCSPLPGSTLFSPHL